MTFPTVWYFPLEPLKERYTEQLSTDWMPSAFLSEMRRRGIPEDHFVSIAGGSTSGEISSGKVLDYCGRPAYAMRQCCAFLALIAEGKVVSGDIIYLQDFWTPGIEGVLYALQLQDIQVSVYAMVHAQTFDEYDFTYPLREWMRPYEEGLMAYMAKVGGALFVASSIHARQIHESVAVCPPIHVVGLPISVKSVRNMLLDEVPERQQRVVYSSRLDKEKRPDLALNFAIRLLETTDDWTFAISTSSTVLRSDSDFILDEIRRLQGMYPRRFEVHHHLTKASYYQLLRSSAVQLNTSLQDYVSWTLLEASICGCDILYPDFRSFFECVPADRRYPFDSKDITVLVDGMMSKLADIAGNPRKHPEIPRTCDIGRCMIPGLVMDHVALPVNVWKMAEPRVISAILEAGE